jgi:hypothetical protein
MGSWGVWGRETQTFLNEGKGKKGGGEKSIFGDVTIIDNKNYIYNRFK